LLDAALESAAAPSWPLPEVLEAIAAQACGVLVLLSYHESAERLAARMTVSAGEGRAAAGDGVDAAAPAQQTAGVTVEDTVTDPDDGNLRMLGAGGQILADLGVGKVIALGREKRAHGLSGFGLEIVSYVADRDALARHMNRHA